MELEKQRVELEQLKAEVVQRQVADSDRVIAGILGEISPEEECRLAAEAQRIEDAFFAAEDRRLEEARLADQTREAVRAAEEARRVEDETQRPLKKRRCRVDVEALAVGEALADGTYFFFKN